MINIPPLKPSTAIKAELLGEISKTWKVGQVLSATTERGGSASSQVLIRLGAHTLEAKTPVPLQTGQEIKLLVKSLAPENTTVNTAQTIADTKASLLKLPVLSILGSSTPAESSSQLATSKLRQFIATQQSFSQLLTLSGKVLNSPESEQKLPIELKQSLQQLKNSVSLQQLSIKPTQLKQQILDSGVFLESKLLNLSTSHANNQTELHQSISRDLKFQLLSAKQQLDSYFFQAHKAGGKSNNSLTPQQLNSLSQLIKRQPSISNIVDQLIRVLPILSLQQLTPLLTLTDSTQSTTPKELIQLTQLIQQTVSSQPQALQTIQLQLQKHLMLMDLHQAIDHSIQKMTSLQLQPLSREADTLLLVFFNLVLKEQSEFSDIQFRIQQESAGANAENKSWLIHIHFEFKSLGKVQSNIHLIDDQISTTFLTEHQETANKIQSLLPMLNKSLNNAGLKVISLSSRQGLEGESSPVQGDSRLLDENA